MSSNTQKITKASASLYHIPLEVPLGDARHGIQTFYQLVIVELETSDSIIGHGHTYTVGFGGKALLEMLNSDLLPWLIGKDADCIEKLWDQMMWKAHYVGRGGLVSFAISAIDIALYDIRAKKAGLPLHKLLGGYDNGVKCYGGGIDLNFDKDKLLENTQKFIDSGMKAVKIKLGRESLHEDLDRIKAVRKHIGRDIDFMVDVNMKWTPDIVKRAHDTLVENDIVWLEEPIIPDDIAGFRKLGDFCKVPLAGGENLHTIYEFQNSLRYGYYDFLQPDAANIGGITGMMKIAALAYAYNVPICSHGMQEIQVSVLSALPNAGYLEIHSFFIDEYTDLNIEIKEGKAMAPQTIGKGYEFDFNKLEPHLIDKRTIG